MCFLPVPACQYRYLLLVSRYGFISLHPRSSDHRLFPSRGLWWGISWLFCHVTNSANVTNLLAVSKPNLLICCCAFFSSLSWFLLTYYLHSASVHLHVAVWKNKVLADSGMLKSHLSHLAVLNGAAWKYCSGHKSGTLGGMFQSVQNRVGKHLPLCSTWQVCIWHAEIGSYPELISKRWFSAKDN